MNSDELSPALARYLARSDMLSPAHGSCEKFLRGAAACLAMHAWEEDTPEGEERKYPFRAQIEDHCPPATQDAISFAYYLSARLEVENGLPLASILSRAFSEDFPNNDSQWLYGDWAYDFGFYIAWEALGAGPSWADDHDYHPTKVPYIMVSCNPAGQLYRDVPPDPDAAKWKDNPDFYVAAVIAKAQKHPLVFSDDMLSTKPCPEFPAWKFIQDDRGNYMERHEVVIRKFRLAWAPDGRSFKLPNASEITETKFVCGDFFWEKNPDESR